MFMIILDFAASIYTVICCRLHRIFCGLESTAQIEFFQAASLCFYMPETATWSLDGEAVPAASNVRIENQPSALTLIR